MKNLLTNFIKSIKQNKRIRNDIILVVVLVALIAVGFVYLFIFRQSGNTVKVTVDGKLYATYSLSQYRVEDIYTGKNNNQLNQLVIKGGKAFVKTATCPDGICVNHRAIFRDGESIICLPNRVVITVVAENSNNTPDVFA